MLDGSMGQAAPIERTGPHADQRDDHCLLTFGGLNWFIRRKQGCLLLLENEYGWQTLNISGVDWDAYGSAALALLEARYGGLV